MNLNFNINLEIEFYFIAILVGFAAALLFVSYKKKISALYYRSIFLLMVCLILLSPVVVKEIREYLENKIVVVMDNSASMNVASRKELADRALGQIKQQFPKNEIVLINNVKDSNLFSLLLNNVHILPLSRLGGVVFITDGQVPDAPKDSAILKNMFPINAVIIGSKNEFDYKVSITQSPKYAIVGDNIFIKVKAEVDGKRISPNQSITLNIEKDGENLTSEDIIIGEEKEFEFKLEHAGQNIFEFSIPNIEGEISNINNKTAVIINAIRDRLKVLLVSGKPHIGERAWRNLLKSDPSVDLVHFTILRSPYSFDLTPSSQLSLIAFPVDELFQRKINDFDLIIFDKYVHYGMLNDRYFSNIAEYVKNGGSFLFEMASDRLEPAIFDSELANILPINPRISQQEIIKGKYVPALTDKGKYHAITSGLEIDAKDFKEWTSQVSLLQTKGENLLKGLENNPLLIVDKVGKGRVALLASDNIWLWSKYPTSRGAYIDLQRKLAHWLMKEPELESGYIKVTRNGENLDIAQRFSDNSLYKINLETPDEQVKEIELLKNGAWLEASFSLGQNGTYKLYNDNGKAFFVVGNADDSEFENIVATNDNFKNITSLSGGKISWYGVNDSVAASDFKFNNKKSYEVKGINKINLFSPWLYMALILLGAIYVWNRESK